MLHFYDSSPYSIDTQRGHLKPACALSDVHINSLVWGEDALAYIHFIPTGLFNLHLVVQDEDLQRASTQIRQCLPYKICSPIPDDHLERIFFDASQPRMFPHSVLLEMTVPDDERHMDDSQMVYIHPRSQLYLDVNDTSRSVLLPPFPDTLRFPTRIAFLDSMIGSPLWSDAYNEGYNVAVLDFLFSYLYPAERTARTRKWRSRTRTCGGRTESQAGKPAILRQLCTFWNSQ